MDEEKTPDEAVDSLQRPVSTRTAPAPRSPRGSGAAVAEATLLADATASTDATAPADVTPLAATRPAVDRDAERDKTDAERDKADAEPDKTDAEPDKTQERPVTRATRGSRSRTAEIRPARGAEARAAEVRPARADRAPADRVFADRTSVERAPADRVPAEAAVADAVTTERLSPERVAAERAGTQRGVPERGIRDRRPRERVGVEADYRGGDARPGAEPTVPTNIYRARRPAVAVFLIIPALAVGFLMVRALAIAAFGKTFVIDGVIASSLALAALPLLVAGLYGLITGAAHGAEHWGFRVWAKPPLAYLVVGISFVLAAAIAIR